MRKSVLFLTCLCIFASTSMAATSDSSHPYTPSPTYPADALKEKVTGSGSCDVVFDNSGHVNTAVMTESTGSKILDKNTIRYARKNWTGQPNTRVSVPIVYQLAPSMAKVRAVVKITGKKPPYPSEARQARIEGSGTIKVSFDESGKVVSATMSKSTGSDILDKNTIKYVTDTWQIEIGRKSTMFVPITYRLTH